MVRDLLVGFPTDVGGGIANAEYRIEQQVQRAAARADDELPAGWTAVFSRSRGTHYYRGPDGLASWERPAAAAAGGREESSGAADAGVGGPLLPGWTPIFSKTRQAFYFKHAESGETTWDRPVG